MEIDSSSLSFRDAYQLMISSIIPRPVAWISTIDNDGQRNVAPFSFFMGIGAKPPMLAVSVARRHDHQKDTARNIRDTGEFVVNMCPTQLAEKMVLTSGEYPHEVDEFQVAGLTLVASAVIKPPGVGESPLRMECKLTQIIKPGDNPADLILGEIVHFHVDDSIVENGQPSPFKLDPIARLGGQNYASLTNIHEIPRPS